MINIKQLKFFTIVQWFCSKIMCHLKGEQICYSTDFPSSHSAVKCSNVVIHLLVFNISQLLFVEEYRKNYTNSSPITETKKLY